MSSIKSVNSSDESSKKSSIKIHEKLYIDHRKKLREKEIQKQEQDKKEESFKLMRS